MLRLHVLKPVLLPGCDVMNLSRRRPIVADWMDGAAAQAAEMLTMASSFPDLSTVPDNIPQCDVCHGLCQSLTALSFSIPTLLLSTSIMPCPNENMCVCVCLRCMRGGNDTPAEVLPCLLTFSILLHPPVWVSSCSPHCGHDAAITASHRCLPSTVVLPGLNEPRGTNAGDGQTS